MAPTMVVAKCFDKAVLILLFQHEKQHPLDAIILYLRH